MNVIVLPTADDLARYGAGLVAEALASYDTNRVNLGLAGGSTPKALYGYLTQRDVAWENVDIWLADERWVPADHEEANAAMALAHLDVPATFHFPTYDVNGHPSDSASEHTDQLRSFMGDDLEPHVVLLGIGDDAHTASLFPGTAALGHLERGYVHNWVETKATWRLTASVPLLHAADLLIFLVSGSGKAEAVSAILEGDEPLPSSIVSEGAGNVTWLLDEAAAMGLETTTVTRLRI